MRERNQKRVSGRSVKIFRLLENVSHGQVLDEQIFQILQYYTKQKSIHLFLIKLILIFIISCSWQVVLYL